MPQAPTCTPRFVSLTPSSRSHGVHDVRTPLCVQLVLVVVEDLQWADAGTLDMIYSFLQAGQEENWVGACVFLLTTRPASTFGTHLRLTRDKITSMRFVEKTKSETRLSVGVSLQETVCLVRVPVKNIEVEHAM